MRAMILAAGLGTRLRPLTYVMPKPVAPVLNRPIVAWIADLLARARLRGRRHQPLLSARADPRGARRRVGLRPADLLQRGARAARHRRRGGQGPRLPGRDRFLPDHLRRRPHRHRPERDAGGPRGQRRARRHPHHRHQARRRHDPVRRGDHRRRRPDPGIPGEARTRGGALGPRQLRHLHVQPGDLRLLPATRPSRAPRATTTSRRASSTGRWTSSRRCSTATCRSTRTRSTPTGTTSGQSASSSRATSTRSPARSGSSRRPPRWRRASTPARARISTGSR